MLVIGARMEGTQRGTAAPAMFGQMALIDGF